MRNALVLRMYFFVQLVQTNEWDPLRFIVDVPYTGVKKARKWPMGKYQSVQKTLKESLPYFWKLLR